MDKHNKISVRINGEDTFLDREKDVKESKVQDELLVAKEEQASAIEDWVEEQEKKKQEEAQQGSSERKELPVLERAYQTKFKTMKVPAGLKQLMVAAISAIVVGIVIGFIMIRLFAGMEASPSQATPSATVPTETTTNGATNTNDNQVATSTQTIAFPGVSAFVVQAGIFSTEDKAKVWQGNLEQSGITGLIWPRDGQYYLFAGVASTKEEGKEIATYLKAQGFDTFVKEWHVASTEKDVAQAEGKWIQSGIETWKSVLPATSQLINNRGGTASDLSKAITSWKQAIPDAASERTSSIQTGFQEFNQAASTFSQNKSTQSLWEMQKGLLSIWYAYEQYGQ